MNVVAKSKYGSILISDFNVILSLTFKKRDDFFESETFVADTYHVPNNPSGWRIGICVSHDDNNLNITFIMLEE